MKTEVTELPDSRVRIDASVDAGGRAAPPRPRRQAARLASCAYPGFRKGKVPPQMVLQRVGREAVLEQALRDALPEWYERAVIEAGVSTVGDPKLDVSELPAEGEPLELTIEIGVRPRGEARRVQGPRGRPRRARGARGGRRGGARPLREGFGSLNPVEREAAEGDFLLDRLQGLRRRRGVRGRRGQGPADRARLGQPRRGLRGGAAGRRARATSARSKVTFPEDYRAEHLAGKDARFEVTVREVREKRLPELDDDFALEASEFDTLDELRADITEKLRVAAEARSDEQFREAAVEAAVANAEVEIPGRARRRPRRGDVPPLRAPPLPPGDRPGDVHPDAGQVARGARRERQAGGRGEPAARGVLVAIADAEGDRGLRRRPRRGAARRRRLAEGREGGAARRSTSCAPRAATRSSARTSGSAAPPRPSSTPRSRSRSDEAEAREKLWTPEKGEPRRPSGRARAGGLWTPGS